MQDPRIRRTGDSITIPGDYQARALRGGFVVQRFWHSLKFRLINRVSPPDEKSRVLDIGCGSGVVADYLARRAKTVDAVDGNEEAVAYAKKQFGRPNLRVHLGLVDEISFAPESFDRIYCLEVIEHLHLNQVEELFSSVHRLLAPSGRFLVTTPNYRSLWPIIELGMDRLRLAPQMRGEQHVTKFTVPRLRELGRSTQLDCLRIGRFSGAAPFLSVVSCRLAERIDDLEAAVRSPFGLVLYGLWTKH